jgi:hypothetical protein
MAWLQGSQTICREPPYCYQCPSVCQEPTSLRPQHQCQLPLCQEPTCQPPYITASPAPKDLERFTGAWHPWGSLAGTRHHGAQVCEGSLLQCKREQQKTRNVKRSNNRLLKLCHKQLPEPGAHTHLSLPQCCCCLPQHSACWPSSSWPGSCRASGCHCWQHACPAVAAPRLSSWGCCPGCPPQGCG